MLSAGVWAQKPTLADSLRNQLTRPALPAIKRVDLQNELGMYYAKTDSLQAMTYAKPALEASTRLSYNNGIANAYRVMGIVATYKNRLSAALSYLNKAAQLFQNTKDESRLGQVYSDIGTAYLTQNQRADAIASFERAAQIHRRLADNKNLLTDLNQLGASYFQDGNNTRAISFYLEAAKLAERINDGNALPLIFTNIGQLMSVEKNYGQSVQYYKKAISLLKAPNQQRDLGIATLNLANLYTEQSNYKQAAVEYNNALSAFVRSNFSKGIQVAYNNLGSVALRQNQFEQAIIPLEKSLAIAMESKNFTGLALTQQNIGYAYTHMGQYQKAEAQFIAAEKSALKYKNNAAVFAEIYNHRSQLDSLTGNFKDAFIRRNRYMKIKDSLLNSTLNRQINELQIKYETEKKQKEIQQLNQQNTLQALNLQNQDVQLYQNKFKLSQQQNEINSNKLSLAQQQLRLRNNQNLLAQKQFESSTRGQKIKLLSEQNTVQQLKLNRNTMIIYSIAAMFILGSIIIYLFYNRSRLKQAAILQSAVLHQQELAAKGIIEAEEQERQRISADLHDGLGQLFTAVKMNMEIIAERYLVKQQDAEVLAEKTLAMVDESCVEVRSIAHQMMPNALLRSGLVSALRDFVNQVHSSRLKITVETIGLDGRLENNIETVLYRVVQESVNNVIKHAQATLIDILLICDANEITITIEDNGKGFDSSDLKHFEGIGLRNMITRIEYLKGTVEISSAPGKGALIAIHVPLT